MKYCKCGKLIPDNEEICDDCYEYQFIRSKNRNTIKNVDDVRCPKCGSNNFFAHQKGYSAPKGCLGAILFIPMGLFGLLFGLLFGSFGANKVKKTCNNCGKRW